MTHTRFSLGLLTFLLLSIGALGVSRPDLQKVTATLCDSGEQVIFSCPLKRSTKIVSLCASKDLSKQAGYLQYRFGAPGRIELEFPQSRSGSQQQFQYSHYFRAQFDLTAITFANDGYEYSIFHDYNGEEKPAVAESGVRVTAKGKENSLLCAGKPRANLANLEEILPPAPEK
ncbi:MAG TPA: hypothetical protein VKB46_11890 [Pyrinomonadaceae bacterium]|nr:hypothetical protein [Pyrinomonadaceae bacterium]